MNAQRCTFLSTLLVAASLMSPVASVTASEQVADWVAPVITGFGYINPLPDAKLQPDPNQDYKVVFDVSKPRSSLSPRVMCWSLFEASSRCAEQQPHRPGGPRSALSSDSNKTVTV